MMLRLLSLCLCLTLLVACQPPETGSASISFRQHLGDMPNTGFAQVSKPRPLSFPADHGAHPTFKNEWWYFTGNLQSPEGKRFGYQITFFRIALTPEIQDRSSNWASNQIWMAHAAITDIEAKSHLNSERFARGAAGLAGATQAPLQVWLDNWQLTTTGSDFPWYLKVEDPNFSINLALNPAKAIVLNGNQGVSQKSPIPGNASHYYSITRLHSTGQLSIRGQRFTVSGLSWLDREWGSSMLDDEQSGWDWFALQFDNGDDLMFYQLRYQDGRTHPNSLGTWVDSNSQYRTITANELKLTALDWWLANDGTRYPVEWRLDDPSRDESWLIKAVIPNQLMDLSVKYWEGAVDVYPIDGGTLVGRGYLEMTGY